MAVIECGMCGAPLEYTGNSIVTCRYCGSQQTIQNLDAGAAAVSGNGATGNASAILKRAFMYLADGNWARAAEYCEKLLDADPENAYGYLGLLLAQLNIRRTDDLINCIQPFSHLENFNKAVRFADQDLKTRLETIANENIYRRADTLARNARIPEEHIRAQNIFLTIPGYKDAAQRAAKCRELSVATHQGQQKERKNRKKLIFIIVIGMILSYALSMFLVTSFSKIQRKNALESQIDEIHSQMIGTTVTGTTEYNGKDYEEKTTCTIYFVDEEHCNVTIHLYSRTSVKSLAHMYDRDETTEYTNVTYTLVCGERHIEFSMTGEDSPLPNANPFEVSITDGVLELDGRTDLVLQGRVDD